MRLLSIIGLILSLPLGFAQDGKVKIEFEKEAIYGDNPRGPAGYCYKANKVNQTEVNRYLKAVKKYKEWQVKEGTITRQYNQTTKEHNKRFRAYNLTSEGYKKSNEYLREVNKMNDIVNQLYKYKFFIESENSNTLILFIKSFSLGRPSTYALSAMADLYEQFFENNKAEDWLKAMNRATAFQQKRVDLYTSPTTKTKFSISNFLKDFVIGIKKELDDYGF